MRHPLSQCWFCKHYTADTGERLKRKKETCQAFPDGIPEEITYNQYDHRNSHPEDNGLQFEKIDLDNAELLKQRFFKGVRTQQMKDAWEYTLLDLKAKSDSDTSSDT